ncbi:hypothetical protein HAU32_11065 [Weissella confusa]|uniref:Uncharacterized protein n=1 Tax=Weissella fermenti TaxID=2987699 RepID=A0ABT6D4Z7_9LACO|nr:MULTISPECIES: hypothetical protein [Weissella]MBJ7689479.1 hypothetical protein [Weissella confusa]MCW0928002.1 hypothetical protein [Weissella sp. LMG 11983]MDF9300592.1 hypothetical protein [Weissella sp. BK2]
MKATITYEEILTRTVEIDVDTNRDILTQAREYYLDSKIILTGDDLQVSSFMVETPSQIFDWQEI